VVTTEDAPVNGFAAEPVGQSWLASLPVRRC